MYKSLNLGGAILTGMFLSGAVIADENVYGKFPVTLKSYNGAKTNSVSYTGQIARHVLHDSLKKIASGGNGSPNAALKTQMMEYFKGSKAGHQIIAPATKGVDAEVPL